MATSRNLLHRSKLKDFRAWLLSQGWEPTMPEPTDIFRLYRGGKELFVSRSAATREHYTVTDHAYKWCHAWIRHLRRERVQQALARFQGDPS